MWQILMKRLFILLPQLAVLSLLMFWLAEFMPGDALSGLSQDPDISQERLEQLRDIHGLGNVWYLRYASWFGNIIRGDFGVSLSHHLPVAEVVGQRAANSFALSLATILLLYGIAIPLGVTAGKHNGMPIEKAISTYTYFMMSMPTVVFAIIVLFVFGFVLGWAPVRGSVGLGVLPGTPEYWFSRLHHMLLPALTGALLGTVGVVQYLRSEVAVHSKSRFVVTARAKGVPQKRIYTHHILRNALLPLTADLCWVLVALVSGSIFIENIFSYPGMGQLFVESIERRDFAVVNFLVVVYGALLVLGSVLADIVVTSIDPRIRIQ